MAAVTRDDYIEKLRDYLRDHPQFNRLLNFTDEEASKGTLGLALDMGLDHYNTRVLPILSAASFATIPSETILIQLAASYVLEMLGVNRTRNSLTYSDAGLTISDTERAGEYRAWAVQFKQDAIRDAMMLKKAINISSVLESGDGLYSSYTRFS